MIRKCHLHRGAEKWAGVKQRKIEAGEGKEKYYSRENSLWQNPGQGRGVCLKTERFVWLKQSEIEFGARSRSCRPVVPKLFRTRHWVLGKTIFPWPGQGGWFRDETVPPRIISH